MRILTSKATLSLLASLATLLVGPAQGAAQARAAAGPAVNWGSIAVVAYPGVGAFNSPVDNPTDANQRWDVGSGIGLGLAVAHVFGPTLQIGAEANLAPSVGVEITDPLGVKTSGKAQLGEAMATGRFMTGGGGGLGFFLMGGLGAMYWGMPSPATSATDFAYRYGGGLEYQSSMRHAIFLEWGQIAAFHKHHGVTSNTVRFSQIRGGIRIGW